MSTLTHNHPVHGATTYTYEDPLIWRHNFNPNRISRAGVSRSNTDRRYAPMIDGKPCDDPVKREELFAMLKCEA